MNGTYVAARVAAELARHGEAMTLTRIGGASVTVKGKRFGSQAETVVNNQIRTTITIKIGNAEIAAAAWPGPPRKKDTLAIAGRTYAVEEVDTRTHDGVTCMHILRITG